MGTAGGGDSGVHPPDAVIVERVIPKKRRLNTAKRDRKVLLNAERAGEILDLRKQGMTYDQIAGAVDLSGQTVAKIIRETCAKVYEGKADAFMDLTMRRYEALLAKLWQRAMESPEPDVEVIEQARKLIADMRALTGIDAPKRQELTGRGGGPVEFAAAEKRMDDRLAAMAIRIATEDSRVRVAKEDEDEDDEDGADDTESATPDAGAGPEVQDPQP